MTTPEDMQGLGGAGRLRGTTLGWTDADDVLAELQAGRLIDPDTGETLAPSVAKLAIEASFDGDEAELLAALGLGPQLLLLDDVHTHAAYGATLARALSRYQLTVLTLPTDVHATPATLEAVLAQTPASIDALVVVGAGTLNDIGKLWAQRCRRPQVTFATAPSMNGYTSVSASVLRDGVKTSVRAQAPLACFFNLEVLARAPTRMIAAGMGDSLCRTTAQTDWRLAHLLLGTDFRRVPFALLARDEARLFADPAACLRGEPSALRSLVRTLVLSGYGMAICNGSYPASQGEHLISHLLDMEGSAHPDTLHGEQIAVTTLTMARVQDALLAGPAPRLRATTLTHADLIARFGNPRADEYWNDIAPKLLTEARADELNQRLSANWAAWQQTLARGRRGYAELAAVAHALGLASPSALGVDAAIYRDAVTHARCIRNRYTTLDLVADSGGAWPAQLW